MPLNTLRSLLIRQVIMPAPGQVCVGRWSIHKVFTCPRQAFSLCLSFRMQSGPSLLLLSSGCLLFPLPHDKATIHTTLSSWNHQQSQSIPTETSQDWWDLTGSAKVVWEDTDTHIRAAVVWGAYWIRITSSPPNTYYTLSCAVSPHISLLSHEPPLSGGRWKETTGRWERGQRRTTVETRAGGPIYL